MKLSTLFSERLRKIRLERGLTQTRLNELSGVHNKVIAKYEAGSLPNAENLKKLAEALEVSADYFLFDHAEKAGIPMVKDPMLYKRYFVLESLGEDERRGVLTLLDSLIARQRLKELNKEFV